MKKSVMKKLRKKITPEIIKKAATEFGKSEDWIRKIRRGEETNPIILAYLVDEALKTKQQTEEIFEKAESL